MKIYTAEQVRAWDAYTIAREPISSIDLMNRAASAWTNRFLKHETDYYRPIDVLCGPGNNGGDGIAIGRYLRLAGFDACIYLCHFDLPTSQDFRAQFALTKDLSGIDIITPSANATFTLRSHAIVIDALFGMGINRALAPTHSRLISDVNAAQHKVYAVDLPSGLMPERPTTGTVLRADVTISFERPKLAFFAPENQDYIGTWEIVPIGLHPAFEEEQTTDYHFLSRTEAKKLYLPRKRHEHKGTRGHACLLTGSLGKMGAAVLSAKACMRTGVGLTTVHLPTCGTEILQIATPEVMVSTDTGTDSLHQLPPQLERFDALGCGPGIGGSEQTAQMMSDLLSACQSKPLVLDADALNHLASNQNLLKLLPKHSILTPHYKEFERLFGQTNHFFEKLELSQNIARKYQVALVLKGANAPVVLPDGQIWFNSTGNPGMATAGSGDVLTGMLTSLLAQGYSTPDAARLGVYLHGLSGDLAAEQIGHDALIASDIIEYLGAAFRKMNANDA